MITPISASVHVGSLQKASVEDSPASGPETPAASPSVAGAGAETVSLGTGASALARPQEAGPPVDDAKISHLRDVIAARKYRIDIEQLALRLAQYLSEMCP